MPSFATSNVKRDERKMQRAYHLVNKYAMSLSVSSVFVIVTQEAKYLPKVTLEIKLARFLSKNLCSREVKM